MIIASIDIGTNTVLMLIAETDKSNFRIKPIKNFYEIPRIGKGMIPNGEIPEDNIKRLIKTLNNYKVIIKNYNCEKFLVTGTNALRTANNSKLILDSIKKETGFEVNVISGDEEAGLSFLGATAEIPANKECLVIDIGGGSTEIIYGRSSSIKFRKSFDAGVVSLTEKFIHHDPPLPEELINIKNQITAKIKILYKKKFKPFASIAIAGTPTTLAAMKMNMQTYDEDLIEGSFLQTEEIKELANRLSSLSVEEIKNKYSSIVEGREDLILTGSIMLLTIMEMLGLKKVKVSSKGIRYGAIVKYYFKNSTD